MQQRRATASGRPSGTDGSDFSYRMVVESRYTKVAKEKEHLKRLIGVQAINQVIGAFLVFLSASNVKSIGSFAILSTSIGICSLVVGEFGRRRSLSILLRLYATISSLATVLSVAHMVRSDFFSEVISSWNFSLMKTSDIVEAVRVLFSVFLQVAVLITCVGLVQNMSSKRA